MQKPAILWFREDLRLGDNPALHAALETGKPLILLYIHDEQASDTRPMGGASRWWLHHSLAALIAACAQRGAALTLLRGAALPALRQVILETGADAVFWNRRYESSTIAADTAIKAELKADGIDVRSFNGRLLVEPWEIKTQSGTPFKVFTPFWKAVLTRGAPRPALPAPQVIPAHEPRICGVPLDSLALTPHAPDWASGFGDLFQPGESGALARLYEFLEHDLRDYSEGRDRPDRRSTSLLSPALRFGDISPVQIWHAAEGALASGASHASAQDLRKFQAELGWREFSYHLLHIEPDLAQTNFQRKFDAFPWHHDSAGLRAWQKGQTGYPIVDAGMRQLWQTGWMHNRVRMIVASFLIKHLLIDWREGERWFWDTLLDADPASNAASWQWVAGSGADAAPYYRIFNPILQGEKFDPAGDYVRQYVPELATMPTDTIHKPWDTPPHVLRQAGISLGRDYPKPIVDHALARERALEALKQMTSEV